MLAWILLVTKLDPVSVFCMMGFSEITGADIYNSATIRFSNGATMVLSGAATVTPSPQNKQIDNKLFGTEGMLTYSGYDGDRSSGSLQVMHEEACQQ